MRAALTIAAGFLAMFGAAFYDSAAKVCFDHEARTFNGRLGIWHTCKGGLTGVIITQRPVRWLED